MRRIEVSCAIIEDNGLVLAAQRGAQMDLPGKWEFPGGKIRAGEDPRECICREILEELGLEVKVVASLNPCEHSYIHLRVRLHPFVCRVTGGRLRLSEHRAVHWAGGTELSSLDWAQADIEVLKAYQGYLEGESG